GPSSTTWWSSRTWPNGVRTRRPRSWRCSIKGAGLKTMKIVVAPDKFKGSLPAMQVAAAIAAGLRAGRPGAQLVTMPVADGGEGTVDAAVAAGFGRVPLMAAGPAGPAGDPVRVSYARRGGVAVVELAGVCGLARLPGGPCSSRAAPLTASSFGAGEVLRGGRAQHAEPGRTGRGRD